jgi:hypothetical protein
MGVDLGQGSKAWSGACAAIVEGDSARVVENAQGSRSTPSVVAFTDGGAELLVGQPAKKLLFARGATPVSVHTQLLGLLADAPELDALRAAGRLGRLDVGADDGADGDARAVVRVQGVAHRPEELTARVVGSLRDAAEDALGGRKVTRKGGHGAGLTTHLQSLRCSTPSRIAVLAQPPHVLTMKTQHTPGTRRGRGRTHAHPRLRIGHCWPQQLTHTLTILRGWRRASPPRFFRFSRAPWGWLAGRAFWQSLACYS